MSSRLNKHIEWAAEELAPWRLRGLSRSSVSSAIDVALSKNPFLVRYDISRHGVAFRTRGNVGDHGMTEGLPDSLRYRAELYKDLLTTVGSRLEATEPWTMAIDVNDGPSLDLEIPIFSFQKPLGTRPVLLPDVDLLGMQYMSGVEYTDIREFADKRDAAIFIGSTSGGVITPDVVRDLSLPRLRSAVYFKDHPDVDFKLPNICQCSGPEAVDALKALDIGGGPRSWAEQFNYKYLLSMDGNGATCSRVAISLRSNSVLLKYCSNNELFYFKGLSPWVHFVPINHDEDVASIIRDGNLHPHQYQQIAREGGQFFQQHLTRDAAEDYVAILLTQYLEILDSNAQLAPLLKTAALLEPALEGVIHVQDTGDLPLKTGAWANDPRLNRAIEGFSLLNIQGAPNAKIEYCSVDQMGNLSKFYRNGEYCGSMGEGKPLYGFGIRLAQSDGPYFRLRYQGLFMSGRMTPILENGDICASEDGSPLKSLKILLQRQP